MHAARIPHGVDEDETERDGQLSAKNGGGRTVSHPTTATAIPQRVVPSALQAGQVPRLMAVLGPFVHAGTFGGREKSPVAVCVI